MKPEEAARVKIDKQLNSAGWDIVSRDEYIPMSTTAVKEALMRVVPTYHTPEEVNGKTKDAD